MTAKKSPSTTASKSTQLTDAPESKVSTHNPDFIMKSDNSTNPVNPVNSDNAVNSTSPANTDNLFDNEQTATDTTEPPKQQRVGKQQRKSDYADFKATYLTPAKLVKRHPVNIEEDVWAQFERIARILGDRGANVGSYINSVLAEHLKLYADDIEIWRKL